MRKIYIVIIHSIIQILSFQFFLVKASNTKIDFMIFEVMREDMPPQEAFSLIDSLLKKEDQLTLENWKLLMKRKAAISMSIGNYWKAAEAIEKLMTHKHEFNQEELLKMELDAATCGLYSGEYTDAINRAFHVLNESKQDSLSYLDVDSYLILNNIGNRTGAIDKSKEYLNRASLLLDNIKDKNKRKESEYKILLGWSGINLLERNIENAYMYLKKADSLKVIGISPYCLETNLAMVYDLENADDIAERYYQNIIESGDIHYNKCVALNNYTDFLINRGRANEALKITDMNLSQLKEVNATHALAVRQMMRFQALRDLGMMSQAIESADSAINLMLQLTDDKNKNNHSLIHDNFESKRLEEEFAKVENENSHLKRWIIGLSCFSLALITGCILLLRQSEGIKRKIRKEEEKLGNIENIHQKELSKMEDDINLKNRELAKLELKNMQMAAKIKSFYETSRSQEKGASDIMNTIKNSLKEYASDKTDWDMFEKYFEEIQPRFYETLLKSHPDLTSGERRMCAFILTGMKTAEIASLCHRSTRTVESMKYRLKKKLNIAGSTTLDNYLLSLTY